MRAAPHAPSAPVNGTGRTTAPTRLPSNFNHSAMTETLGDLGDGFVLLTGQRST
jgi:hypothetical protein